MFGAEGASPSFVSPVLKDVQESYLFMLWNGQIHGAIAQWCRRGVVDVTAPSGWVRLMTARDVCPPPHATHRFTRSSGILG